VNDVKTFFDCIPCFLRQSLDSIRMVTPDEGIHAQLLREVLRALSEMDLCQSPPAMSQRIHRLIRELTGESDPYRAVKDQSNSLALDLYPNLKRCAEDSADPLETAIRLAIAGNVIDMGVNNHLSDEQVHESIRHALAEPLDGDVTALKEAIPGAKDILYLTDNAGEIVFDKLLIEQIPFETVTVVVRGSPIINDATMEDAEVTGLIELVKVMDNGSDAPGTILEDCSEAFRGRFHEADLVIAKGQGNYETLSEVNKDIFFILKAKCPVIAKDLGCEVGSLVLRRSSYAGAGAGKGNVHARI
jgi:uncharacterized protein with ATP-grasp and redox domains